jgi:glutaredoxin
MDEIEVLTRPDCAACDQVRWFLAQRGIPYRERDVETDPDAAEELRRLGASAPPVVRRGDAVVPGFDAERLAALLEGPPPQRAPDLQRLLRSRPRRPPEPPTPPGRRLRPGRPARTETAEAPPHEAPAPDQILEWADAYHARTGRWPRWGSGPVTDAPGCAVTWAMVDRSLRGPASRQRVGSGLGRFLSEHRAPPPEERPSTPDPAAKKQSPAAAERRSLLRSAAAAGKASREAMGGRASPYRRYTLEEIVRWAEAHRTATGAWPTRDSGPITEAPEQLWRDVDIALVVGSRGLAGGSSLAALLAARGSESD